MRLLAILTALLLLTACGAPALAVPRSTNTPGPTETSTPLPLPSATFAPLPTMEGYPGPIPLALGETPAKVACIATDGITRYYVHPQPSLLGPPPWPELPCPLEVTPGPVPTELPAPTPLPVPVYPARSVLIPVWR